MVYEFFEQWRWIIFFLILGLFLIILLSLKLLVYLFLLLFEDSSGGLLLDFLIFTRINALVESHDVLVYISRGFLLNQSLGLIFRLLLGLILLLKERYE